MHTGLRFLTRLFLVALTLAAAGCATVPTAPAPAPMGPAPLVDRELYFDNPELAGAQLSPDGAFITFLKPYQGVMNVWVKGRTEAFTAARPLTADQRPVGRYFWSRDAKLVLYVQDKGGDENFHLYAVDPRAAAGAAGVPASRDLTPGEKLRVAAIAVPRKTPDIVVIGLNDRDPSQHDVYRLTLSTGQKELVRLNKEGVAGWTADLEGNLRLALKLDDKGGTEILRVAGDSLEPLTHCSADESCSPTRFHKDGKRVYLETNTGADDLSRLVLLDVATGKEELVESDPEKQVDFGGADFSEATEELAATFYEGDRLRTYPKLPTFKKDFETVKKALPQGDVSFLSRSNDEAFALVGVNSDLDPGAVYLYERASGKVELLFRPRPKLPVETLAPMKPVRITGRDGVVFTAYLTVPRGSVGPGPAVLYPHGGPWDRDSWGYDSFAQFLANRGYVVLQPNFRGSTGYGKKFLNLGNGQWGTGSMQHDLSDAREWLVKQGLAAPGKVAIMGGSYGGYATLAGVAFTPELYAAGVDIVGPSNLVTLLNSIPPYWAPIKKRFAVRVGDLDQPKDVERLQAQSPLNSAAKITAPLLVIQGANDPRVKQAEADQIVVALRENKLPVEYLVAPDEGHGFRGRENRLAMMVAIERFLGKHLGGRVQDTVLPDIAAKLAAITVEVASVKRPSPANEKVSAAVFDATQLKAGRFSYRISGLVQRRAITGSAEIVVAQVKGKPAWTITRSDKLVMGDGRDMVTIDGKTLLPTSRSIEQGPMVSIDLSYGPTGVKGAIHAGPQTMAVNAKSESPAAADGSALGVLLGTLPLNASYRASILSFNIQGNKVTPKVIAVTGEEQVEVAKVKLDAWKVEVSGDGTADLAWVEKGGAHRLLKFTMKLPQGMGTLTQELVK